MKKLLVAAALIALAGPAVAQDAMKETRLTPDVLTWKDNPAFPKGIQIATLVGDPAKAGDVVVLRLKFPANFQMSPHTHPYSEVVTVISGTIGSTHGEKFEKEGEMLKPGSLWCIRQNTRIMLGPEMRRPSSKFSSPGQEASITSTRLTIRARRQTEVDHTDSRDAGKSIPRRVRPWLAFRASH